MNRTPPICIAGMHRSGTSLVTRLLHACGLYLGPQDGLMPQRQDNPEGFWEYLPLVQLNDEILSRIGCGWDSPPDPETAPELLRNLEPAFAEKADRLIRPLANQSPWGWKDPRNSLTLPFWLRLLQNLRILICLRHPAEVVRSLAVRNHCSSAFGFNLWLRYHQHLLLHAPPQNRLVTHYEAFFCDPVAELRRITSWLGWPVTEDKLQEGARIVREKLRHHWLLASDRNLFGYSPETRSVYAELCSEAGPVGGAKIRKQSGPEPVASASGSRNRCFTEVGRISVQTAGPGSPAPDPVVSPQDSVLIFLHIPKTAGSTMRRIILRQYDPAGIFVLDGWRVPERDFQNLPAAERAKIQVLCGHQFFGLHEVLARPASYITFLRNPVERIVSQYYHVLRSTEHYLHRIVTDDRLSLADFACAGLAPELDNGLVRYLAGIRNLPCGAIGTEHLEIAKENLRTRFVVAGLLERFDESILLMKRILGWRPPVYEPTNVGRNRPDSSQLDPDAAGRIAEANPLDQAIYGHANNLLEERIAREGDGFRRELASFATLKALPKTSSFLQTTDLATANRLNLIGEKLMRTGETVWSLQSFMKAAEVWPQHVPANLNLGIYYLNRQEPAMALPPLKTVQKLDRTHPQIGRLLERVRELQADQGPPANLAEPSYGTAAPAGGDWPPATGATSPTLPKERS